MTPARANQSPRDELRLLATLGALLAFASISTDLFLPALPAMAKDLGAKEGELEFVVSTYLLGFGFGQLFWGPVSDRFGRRRPILIGLLVFILGSAGCALSTTPTTIILWRIIQAMGASAGVALARAMVRDIYERDRAARVLSILMTVMAVAPLLGPIAGAQILAYINWQAIFWTLSAIGLATILAVLRLPESLSPERRSTGTPLDNFKGYAAHFQNPVLLSYSAAIGLFYVGNFAVIAGAPFAYINYYGLLPQTYALIFASVILGLMAANLLNAVLVRIWDSDLVLLIGGFSAALIGLCFAVVATTDLGGLTALIMVNFLFISMNGLILANAISGALSRIVSGTGGASAIVGAIQYGGGMIGAATVGWLADGTPGPLGIVSAVGGCGCLLFTLLALWRVRPQAGIF